LLPAVISSCAAVSGPTPKAARNAGLTWRTYGVVKPGGERINLHLAIPVSQSLQRQQGIGRH
jgi:hypothetical protein